MADYIWGIIWTRTGELDGEVPTWYESKEDAVAEWNSRDYKYWPSPLVRAPVGPYVNPSRPGQRHTQPRALGEGSVGIAVGPTKSTTSPPTTTAWTAGHPHNNSAGQAPAQHAPAAITPSDMRITNCAATATGTQEKDETDDHHTLLRQMQTPVPQLQEHRMQMPQQARRRDRTEARVMTYTRSPEARQRDALTAQVEATRQQLEATRTELQQTRKELHEARQIIAIAKTATPSQANGLTVHHRKPVAECGTYSGYVRHVRNGEDRCDPCKTAQALYLREYRARKAV